MPKVKSQTKQTPGYPHNDYVLRVEDAVAMPRIAIESIEPVVEQGRFAAKAVVGMPVTVGAVIFADGHDKLAGDLLWREVDEVQWHRLPLQFLGNDHWSASFQCEETGRYEYTVRGWTDPFVTWQRGVRLILRFRPGVSTMRPEPEEWRGTHEWKAR